MACMDYRLDLLFCVEFLFLSSDLAGFRAEEVGPTQVERAFFSAEGVNFDFLLLNAIGHAGYTIYNSLMYFNDDIQVCVHRVYIFPCYFPL